jgi:hypothetical protein
MSNGMNYQYQTPNIDLFFEFMEKDLTDQREAIIYLLRQKRTAEADFVLTFDDFAWLTAMCEAALFVDQARKAAS